MDKQKLQQQVNELKAKLAEMEAELTKPEVTINYWQPKVGDKFFYVDVWGYCSSAISKDNLTDRCRIFETHTKAQAYAEYVKAEEALKAEIARLNEGWWPDWSNMDSFKFTVDYVGGGIKVASHHFTKSQPNFMHIKSKELAKKLIQTHSKELITYLSY